MDARMAVSHVVARSGKTAVYLARFKRKTSSVMLFMCCVAAVYEMLFWTRSAMT